MQTSLIIDEYSQKTPDIVVPRYELLLFWLNIKGFLKETDSSTAIGCYAYWGS